MKQIVVLLSIAISSALLPVSAEIIPGTNLSVNFESGHILGSGRHLNMQRVPVIDIDTGNVTFYDASFKFTFTPEQGLIFEQITSAAISPPVSVANIVPGIYKSQGGYCYILEGPTALSTNRSIYTIRGYTDDNSCRRSQDSFTAQIASGSANGHPDIGDREIVPNLKDSYVYGFVANAAAWSGSYVINSNWQRNELIGVRQGGEQLIIGLFSEGVDNNDVPNDFKDPRETAILTKVNE